MRRRCDVALMLACARCCTCAELVVASFIQPGKHKKSQRDFTGDGKDDSEYFQTTSSCLNNKRR
jgi:hypothetical protein